MKTTAIVIAPDRGTYNRTELGYLRNFHADKVKLISAFDGFRRSNAQKTVSELDGSDHFSGAIHTRGDNASPLIYACGYLDFLSIDKDKIDIVAITGNSMGWYTALACAGALDPMGGLEIVNTMGSLMQDTLIGGQLIYPFVDDEWQIVQEQYDAILEKITAIDGRPNTELTISIRLGGMFVLAGNKAGLSAFETEMPRVQDRFPMRLPNHAAFHSHLQSSVAERGRTKIDFTLFQQPKIPVIDGRGAIWFPKSSAMNDLYEYTLTHQVIKTYDYTRAVQTPFGNSCQIWSLFLAQEQL